MKAYTLFRLYSLKVEVPQSALMLATNSYIARGPQVIIPASHCIVPHGSYSAWLQHTKGGPAELPGLPQSHEML